MIFTPGLAMPWLPKTIKRKELPSFLCAFCTEHHDYLNPACLPCLRGPSDGWALRSPSQRPCQLPSGGVGWRAASPDKGFLCKQNRLPLKLPSGQSTKGSSAKQGQRSPFPSARSQNDCAKGDVKIFHTTVQGQAKPNQASKLNQDHLWWTIFAPGFCFVLFCFLVSVWLLCVSADESHNLYNLCMFQTFPKGWERSVTHIPLLAA